jgi:hypothetical protein
MTIEVFGSYRVNGVIKENKKLVKIVREIINEEKRIFKLDNIDIAITIHPENEWLSNPEWLRVTDASRVGAGFNKKIIFMNRTYIHIPLRETLLTKVFNYNKEKIRQTIKHEFVHLKLSLTRNNYKCHGKQFISTCKQYGLNEKDAMGVDFRGTPKIEQDKIKKILSVKPKKGGK